MSSTSDTVTTSTNSATGYTLSVRSQFGELESKMQSPAAGNDDTIDAASGSQASPGVLSANEWGYRVDGIGGFGAGPTNTEDNVASSVYTWAGMPDYLSTSDTLRTTSQPASSDEVTIWYGAKVDTTIQSGEYSVVVTYTAVTN